MSGLCVSQQRILLKIVKQYYEICHYYYFNLSLHFQSQIIKQI